MEHKCNHIENRKEDSPNLICKDIQTLDHNVFSCIATLERGQVFFVCNLYRNRTSRKTNNLFIIEFGAALI